MQIQNINSAQYNNSRTNFKSIKKLELCGLYKKNPELGSELINTFRQNTEAIDFCKKYDVSVFFDAVKDGYNRFKSSLYIFYDNPADSKMKKFFKFLNSSEDKIQIHGIDYSLQDSTHDLKNHMLPSGYLSEEGNVTGVLSSNIKNTDEKIQEALNKKATIKTAKLEKEKAEAERKEKLLQERKKVNATIKELIDSTK